VKRPDSKVSTARSNPHRYLLISIPPTFWKLVQQKARKQEVSVHALLELLDHWLHENDIHRWVERAGNLARANPLPPHLQREYDALQRKRRAEQAARRAAKRAAAGTPSAQRREADTDPGWDAARTSHRSGVGMAVLLRALLTAPKGSLPRTEVRALLASLELEGCVR
jgi:hypothetical protein